MITAIMIITSMYIQGDMRTPMPSMEECMDAKMQVMEQDPNASVICIPYYKEDKSAKMSERMGGMMREMMGMMKEYNDE
jgi:low affinity Fe/Cu permease|tara:strand:- start:696 stop:932 length:237 start_codon:yes stop_codon:yes gene_type:complete